MVNRSNLFSPDSGDWESTVSTGLVPAESCEGRTCPLPLSGLWTAVFPQHLCRAVPPSVPVPTSSCSYNSSHIGGEGNGKPLQCSCLENPRDEGAWWAAVYGVTQSRT